MRKAFFLFCLLIFFITGAVAQNSRWIGNYSYNEEDLDIDWNRTSYWFQLFVKESNGKLIGVFSQGINGEATRRFQMSVKTKGNKARFYYEKCSSPIDGETEPCIESEFIRGNLLLEFEATSENSKPVIYTIWRKLNLAMQTESGKSGKKIIFFRKF